MSLFLKAMLLSFCINYQALSLKKYEKFLLLVCIQMDQMDAKLKLQVNAFANHCHHSNINNYLLKNRYDGYG